MGQARSWNRRAALLVAGLLVMGSGCGDSGGGSTSGGGTGGAPSTGGTGAASTATSSGGAGGTGGTGGGTMPVCNGDALVSGAGCGEAGKCSLQFSANFEVVVGCCPAGTGTVGQACDPTKGMSTDHAGFVCDDCAVGLVCVDFVCRYYCDAKDLVCPDGLTCHPTPGIPDAPDYGDCE